MDVSRGRPHTPVIFDLVVLNSRIDQSKQRVYKSHAVPADMGIGY